MKKIQSYSDYQKGHQKPGVVGVVYSNPDGGKSTALMTLTKSYKTLYFDIEGLAATVFDSIPDENKDAKNLFLSSGLDNLEDVITFLDSDEAKNYDVIVIDSISYLVGVMTARANPAALKGNAVFGFYRDLGRNILLILEKAKSKGINLFMSFQASDDLKKNGGAWMPKMDGKEGIDRIKEVSDIMLFIEKTGYGKRTVWQDTDESFAYTKSKGLPADHKEKIEFENMDNFSFDFILGDKELPTNKEREENKKDAIDSIEKAKTMEELISIWTAINEAIEIDKDIAKAKDKRKKELESPKKKKK